MIVAKNPEMHIYCVDKGTGFDTNQIKFAHKLSIQIVI